MNTDPRSLALLAVLLLSGSALAQASDRENRRCTSNTLSAHVSAPCSDDAVNDRQRVLPARVRPSGKMTAGKRSPNPVASTQPGTKHPGKVSTGALGATAPLERHRQAR